MKVCTFVVLFAAVVFVDCTHTFIGTNINSFLAYHQNVQYNSMIFRKRVENLYFVMAPVPFNNGRFIRGIMLYDLTYSGALANITQGGVGFKFVNIRMKSDRGQPIHFDVYVFT